MRSLTKYSLAFLIWLMLVLPLFQNMTGIFRSTDLSGDFVPAEKPELTWDNWYSGIYQSKMNDYIEENIGFHNTLVRLNNQLDFSLFGEVKAEGVVRGEDNYLFEYDYIRGMAGLDYVGEGFIREKMGRMKYLHDLFLEERGARLILVLEPSKARFFPDKVPSGHIPDLKPPTNFDTYRAMAAEMDLKTIDFNEYFLRMKDTASYPLYPPYGIHWSIYGMTFCADSMISTIENHWPAKLPGYSYGIYTSKVPLRTDNDVEKALNLLFPLPSPVFGYPEYEFDTLHREPGPNVLVVADSYYFNIFNTRIPYHLFNNEAFWYFNALVYPDYYYEQKRVTDIDVKQEVERQDFIFLMVTERFMHRFDWRFIDNLFSLYAPDYLYYPEYEYVNDLVNNDTRFKELVEESQATLVPLEKLLWENARFLFMEKEWGRFMMLHGLERQKEIIMGDTAWYRHVKEKATEQGISVDEMLEKDAEYIFRQDYPALYEVNSSIRKNRESILYDQLLQQRVNGLMNEFNLSPGRAKEVLAWKLYLEERIVQIERSIRNDEDWLRHVAGKAAANGILLDEMVTIDAEYVLDQELDSLAGKTK